MFKTFLTIGALTLGSIGFASAATVENGSFEDGQSVLTNGNWGIGSLPGWTNTSGGIEVQTQPTLGLTPYDGSRYIELDGNSNYTISQSVALTVGNYLLSFAYSPRVEGGSATNGIGFAIASLSGSITGPDVMNGTSVGAWTYLSYAFSVAEEGSYLLSFSGVGTDESFGGLLDDVSISAVPLPAGGLLLLGALGGLAAMRRRKSI